MRLWILVGCAVLIVGAALWPFGRKTEQLAPVPVPPSVASKPPEAPKPEPARVVEVIDLARAYEPVREPEEPAGAVNPASFIQVPEGPRQIPPALAWDDMPERIDVMPREVSAEGVWIEFPAGTYQFAPRAALFDPTVEKPPVAEPRTGREKHLVKEADGSLRPPRFIPRGIPYPPDVEKWLPQSDSVSQFIPVEDLKVMPREVK